MDSAFSEGRSQRQQQPQMQQSAGPSWATTSTPSNRPPKKPKLPSSLKGRLAGPTASYDENERIHIIMAITLARFISDQELTSDPKPIFSEALCSKIREIISWPYFASKVRLRGTNLVPSNNAIRHIWYCLQTHGTARRPPVKTKAKKPLAKPKNDCTDFPELPINSRSARPSNPQAQVPANWPLYGRDFI